MLQQTRVAVAIAPYQRFVARFPTARALASAPSHEVRAMWSGLGYYRRAERLQHAAREIVARGEMPRAPAELRRLPGVGPYTAAAVASIAFGVAEPAIDGNVQRVLARLLRERRNPARGAARARVEATARALLDPRFPGDSNQALMELGATVCVPLNPRCGSCPLAADCGACGAGAERYPSRERPPARRRERWLVLAVQAERRWLLVRRPAGAVFLADRWLLPWVDNAAGDAAALRQAEERYGARFVLAGGVRGRARHAITFRDIEVAVARARLEGEAVGGEDCAERGWFSLEELDALPTSSLVGKSLRALERAERDAGGGR